MSPRLWKITNLCRFYDHRIKKIDKLWDSDNKLILQQSLKHEMLKQQHQIEVLNATDANQKRIENRWGGEFEVFPKLEFHRHLN